MKAKTTMLILLGATALIALGVIVFEGQKVTNTPEGRGAWVEVSPPPGWPVWAATTFDTRAAYGGPACKAP